MKLKDTLVLRQVAGEYMIVNPFAGGVNMTRVYSLNESAAWLWKQLEEKEFTAQDMARLLCGEYEVEMPAALADAEELCGQWREAGLVAEE